MTFVPTHQIYISTCLALAASLSFSSGTAQAQATIHPGDVLIEGDLVVQVPSGGGGNPSQGSLYVEDFATIDGNLCLGNSCGTAETFQNDETMRFRYTALSIQFDDSSSATSPNNDWTLRINDPQSRATGGIDKFAIEDDTAGTTPFTIEAGLPDHAFYVDKDGNVGFGTNSPGLDLHMISTDSPGVRFEQSGAGGNPAQTWDIAGNDVNFFVRDVSNAGTLPFKILAGAPTDSVVVDSAGFVGIGTAAPDYPLHVKRSDGTAQFRVQETSTAAGNLSLMFLDTAGGRARLQMKGAGNAAQTGDWSISAGDTFVLQERVAAFNVMIVDQAGNMTVGGALTQNSDKNAKMAILPVDPDEILAKVAALPISAWTYKNDAESGIRHIGPMAQDFHAAFETGAGPTGISTIDTSGVALAAIKALVADINGLSEENAAQRDLIVRLTARLEALEQQTPK